MALDLDAFETWRAIAKEPDIFAPMRTEAAKSARSLIVKFLKSKSVGLERAGSIRKALGNETFGLIVDGMKDTEVKALVARFDRHHAEAKSASAEWRRHHLLDLVRGDARPAAKPVKRSASPRKAAKKRPNAESARPSHVSAGAVRKR